MLSIACAGVKRESAEDNVTALPGCASPGMIDRRLLLRVLCVAGIFLVAALAALAWRYWPEAELSILAVG